MKKIHKTISLFCGLLLAVQTSFAGDTATVNVKEGASIKDSSNTITGVDRIVITVRELDTMLDFYLSATNFKLESKTKSTANQALDRLYGQRGVSYRSAVLSAPNMRLELIEYLHNDNADTPLTDMPVQGPGMTHTCYQSPIEDPGYDKFVAAGIKLLTRGDTPVDIGGYGVTYAYGYDPEGNVLELEQLDQKFLSDRNYDSAWSVQASPMWLSQVALVTPDLSALTNYYEKVLGFAPYRTGSYKDNEKLDAITNIDNLALSAAWFKLDGPSKVMEIWQYTNPVTERPSTPRSPDSLGYHFSLSVDDIDQEYLRLKKLGIEFLSAPQRVNNDRLVFARDIDGNIYSLRQAIKK